MDRSPVAYRTIARGRSLAARNRQISIHSVLRRRRDRHPPGPAPDRPSAERGRRQGWPGDVTLESTSPPSLPRAQVWRTGGPDRPPTPAPTPARPLPPPQPHARSILGLWKPRAQPHPAAWTTGPDHVDHSSPSVDDRALSVGRAWNMARSPKPPHVAIARRYRPLHLVVLGLTTTRAKRIVRRVA